MADPSKHQTYTIGGVVGVGGANLMSDLKSLFSILGTRRSKLFAYGFIFTFVAFTAFLAFSPSTNSSSPWFNNIFSTSSSTSASSQTSQFSSLFSYLFPNSSQPILQTHPPNISTPSLNNKNITSIPNQSQQPHFNQTVTKQPQFNQTVNTPKVSSPPSKNETVKGVNTPKVSPPPPKNETVKVINTPKVSSSPSKNETLKGVDTPKDSTPSKNETVKAVTEQNRGSNHTTTLLKESNTTTTENTTKGDVSKNDNMGGMMHCDIFDGRWVKDDSYPLYPPGSCPLIDEQFNCFDNGRPDGDFQKLRWQPKGCNIPRLKGSDMLELLRGKRLVFVGDSLNRNMWESLVCILRNSVSDKSKVFEASGRREFRTDNSYLFIFKDYDCTVEFFRSPFLVQEWEMPETNGSKKETLRLDLVEKSSTKYKNADIIVFNTGHWWTHEKTSKGKDYYQEGSHVYGELNVVEAFRKALTTWARWIDININPKKTLVLFRGYSASHFSGGRWNSGGQCDDETEPIKNDTYLAQYPPKMRVLESVLKGTKIPVSYLNITTMTDYRKDAHPSVYRKKNVPEEERKSPLRYQDCSHWCLPGVPDSWNELLYAQLLIKRNERKQQEEKQQQQKQPKVK